MVRKPTSEPSVLTSHVAVTGPLSVSLFVSSNSTDTDFVAKVTDVYPDGTDMLIQDGIVRMRWRGHRAHFSPAEPEVCL